MNGIWTVNVFSGLAGEIASGTIDDPTGAVLTAYTGPQVAWGMARGGPGAFGGKEINSYTVWGTFCLLFLIGLVDWRRPFSLRTVDLLAMLSFSASLWFFNRGHIFAAMPLVYPGLVWLLGRCIFIGKTGRAPRGAPVWPVWALVGATVFLGGFRIGLNTMGDSNVIDVGLSGVIGAERIATGVDPYGNFPIEGNRPDCGPADSSGEVRDRIQTNGRCEAADAQGDTYGPVSYEAYLPGYWMFGWSGKWDSLPAAHATTVIWDTLCIIGLWLVGLRFGGVRLAATLAFAWVAWPFSQYISSSNTNDMIQPALLIFGFYFTHLAVVTRRLRHARRAREVRRRSSRLPLWSGYPDARDKAAHGSTLRLRRARRPPALVLRALPRRATGPRSDRLRPSHLRLPVRALLAVLALGLGPVPRKGAAEPVDRAARATGGARDRRARPLSLAPLPNAGSDRGVLRRAPRRLRAGADALVVALPRVVLPVRRDRDADAALRGIERPVRVREEDELPAGLAAGLRGFYPIGTRIGSQLVARPSVPHSTSTPSIRTSPSAPSSRSGKPSVKRRIGPVGDAAYHRVVQAPSCPRP